MLVEYVELKKAKLGLSLRAIVFLQNLFWRNLRYFLPFTRFCVEKNWTKHDACGEKKTSIRYEQILVELGTNRDKCFVGWNRPFLTIRKTDSTSFYQLFKQNKKHFIALPFFFVLCRQIDIRRKKFTHRPPENTFFGFETLKRTRRLEKQFYATFALVLLYSFLFVWPQITI